MKPFEQQLVMAIVMLGAVACATAQDDAPMSAPAQAAAPDPRIGEMQTTMTELLERIDVLNDRIAHLEEDRAATPAPVAAATPSTATSPTVAAPQRTTPAVAEATSAPPQRALVGAKLADDYRQAIVLFGRGRHAEARRGFQAVFDAEPSGDLADNALFWIGETYFAAGDFTNATRYYMRVVNEYSEENKAPDALFKVALAHERTGDLALARTTLQQVIDRYPYSSPASSAKAEMQRIRY